ncbi:hypothetical protein dqs_1801 [Azoarcus olearius]|uniref:hypothetical protein n=1 Tax=Azoarcus sp. (strain BH72) TaxID=418699 RepID=UPI0008064219|nr:hypothetical protein [Azoarcus olearius]ANQ84839.1 hypothetical protein dqs_1801 [Azoarcus olearius]
MSTHAELLALALAGDATAAAALWRAIDAGTVDDATAAAWARSVATQVVAKVINPEIPANRARENARAALGLEGPIDKNADLRGLVAAIPEATPSQLAAVADLLCDVRGASRYKVMRQIEYIKRKLKKKR